MSIAFAATARVGNLGAASWFWMSAITARPDP